MRVMKSLQLNIDILVRWVVGDVLDEYVRNLKRKALHTGSSDISRPDDGEDFFGRTQVLSDLVWVVADLKPKFRALSRYYAIRCSELNLTIKKGDQNMI